MDERIQRKVEKLEQQCQKEAKNLPGRYKNSRKAISKLLIE